MEFQIMLVIWWYLFQPGVSFGSDWFCCNIRFHICLLVWKINESVEILPVLSFPRRRKSRLKSFKYLKTLDSRLRGNDKMGRKSCNDWFFNRIINGEELWVYVQNANFQGIVMSKAAQPSMKKRHYQVINLECASHACVLCCNNVHCKPRKHGLRTPKHWIRVR